MDDRTSFENTGSHSLTGHLLEYCLPLLLHSDEAVQQQATQLLLTTCGNNVFTLLRRQKECSDLEKVASQALQRLAWHSGHVLKPDQFRFMYLECLGTVNLFIGNRPISIHDWRQHNQSHAGWNKVLAVVAYLSYRGRQGATTDELIDIVWHGLAQKNTLARTIAGFRRIVRHFSNEQFAEKVLVFEQQRYILAPEFCVSDVDVLNHTIRYAEQQEHNGNELHALKAYAMACMLYRGTYLSSLDLHTDDIDLYREQLLHTFIFALERQVEFYRERTQYHRCIELCCKGLRYCPIDQDLTVYLLESYAALGLTAQIYQTYQRYRDLLQDNVESDDQVDQWMSRWRSTGR
ncbi:MAG: AfsR/SARP family transcriptional regulator [Chloroflexus sp.]|uniref:AfsR/SARP family transcriptional regulator n=1 Tax=Chloroflexus sp. TaxID=1904827 RepID=UPI00404AC2DF